MKTQLKILIETNKMVEIMDENNKIITPQIEEQIHNVILGIIREQLGDDALNEYFFNCELEGINYLCNSGLDDLSNLGNIKVTLINENKKEQETLSEFVNESVIEENKTEEQVLTDDDIVEEEVTKEEEQEEEEGSVKEETEEEEEEEEEDENENNEEDEEPKQEKRKYFRRNRPGIEIAED